MLEHEVRVMPCPNCTGYNITTRPHTPLTNNCHCNDCGKNYDIVLADALRSGGLSIASSPYTDKLGMPVALDRLDIRSLASNVRRLTPYNRGYVDAPE